MTRIFELVSDDPFFETPADLSGVRYSLELRRDLRHDRWVLNVRTETDDLIVGGIRLIPGVNLIGPYTDERLPPGALEVATNSTTFEPPRGEDLGAVAALVYSDEEDVAAFETIVRFGDPIPIVPVNI